MKRIIVFSTFLFICSCAFFGQKSKERKVERCGFLPHCVSSVDNRDFFKISPLKHEFKTIKQARLEVLDYLKKQERVKVEFTNENYIHATYHSKIIGFVDDVEFYFENDLVQIRSISRIGISDLGVNRSRVDKIRKDIFK